MKRLYITLIIAALAGCNGTTTDEMITAYTGDESQPVKTVDEATFKQDGEEIVEAEPCQALPEDGTLYRNTDSVEISEISYSHKGGRFAVDSLVKWQSFPACGTITIQDRMIVAIYNNGDIRAARFMKYENLIY